VSAPITPVHGWAVVGPPRRNDSRWIADWTFSSTRSGAIAKLLENFASARGAAVWRQRWSNWRRRDWTVERVTISPTIVYRTQASDYACADEETRI
jgi:hypothetical protein